MIDKNFLRKYAVKSETSLDNVVREYVQNLFLRSFYTKLGSQDFLFKGGTALKLVFGSPRFSEDLDFTGVENSGKYEDVLESTLLELSAEGIVLDLSESKATTGGHLGTFMIEVFGENIEIQNHISFRKSDKTLGENIVITSDMVPAYNVYILERSVLIAEKVTALITRAKPRDFFDLYFFLRNEPLRKHASLDKIKREKILANLEKVEKEKLEDELKRFLPRSFWSVVKDLPSALKRELV